MIGADLPQLAAPRRADAGEPRLDVRRPCRLPRDDRSASISTTSRSTVRAGEIVGIAGVSGNGQQELMAALSGETHGRRAVRRSRICGERRRPARRRRAAPRSACASCRRSGSAAARCRAMSLAENALLTAHRHGMVRRAAGSRHGASTRSPRDCIDASTSRPAARARRRAACRAATCRSSSSAARSLQEPKRADRRAADLGRGRRRAPR